MLRLQVNIVTLTVQITGAIESYLGILHQQMSGIGQSEVLLDNARSSSVGASQIRVRRVVAYRPSWQPSVS